MCLHNNPKEVAKVLKGPSVITCWKRVRFSKSVDNSIVLCGPYQQSYIYQEGENKAIFNFWEKPRLNKKKRKKIHTGIHVYKKQQKNYSKHEMVIKVTALKSDLLGVGCGEMVFKKIFISKRSYQRAIRKAQKYYEQYFSSSF